jgi:hypothetical protein
MQGRYFLPLLPLLALAMPTLPRRVAPLGQLAGPAALGLGAVVMGAGVFTVWRAFG